MNPLPNDLSMIIGFLSERDELLPKSYRDAAQKYKNVSFFNMETNIESPWSSFDFLVVNAATKRNLEILLGLGVLLLKGGSEIQLLYFGKDLNSEDILRVLRYCGFVNAEAAVEMEMFLTFKAQRPGFDNTSSVKLSTGIIVQNEDCLVDEDALLQDEPFARPNAAEQQATCGEKRKKIACKNCTCGLVEKEDTERIDAVNSSKGCGSCALGDAFRCAKCPYLGTPPFKPGDVLKLDTVDDI